MEKKERQTGGRYWFMLHNQSLYDKHHNVLLSMFPKSIQDTRHLAPALETGKVSNPNNDLFLRGQLGVRNALFQ